MTDRKPTTAEIAQAALDKAEATNALVRDIHDALMKPHPAYNNRSLLDAISTIAARAQAGEIVAERIVWYAKLASAIGAVGALVWWGSKP